MTNSKANWLGINADHIMAINESHGLCEPARSKFIAMQEAARDQGVDVSIASSFRSFDRQLAIWQSKWNGQKPVYTLAGDKIDIDTLSDLEKVHAIMIWSALPGASRHHWGTDLDVYDQPACLAADHSLELIPKEYAQGGPCYALNSWLDNHAKQYGFYRPYARYNNGVAPEPWHISYLPVAKMIVKQLDLDQLYSQLESTEIGGKSTILAHLPSLFAQYTLNGESL